MAVAVGLGLPWDGAFRPIAEWHLWRREGHDVSGLEVKSTDKFDGHLILHKAPRTNPKLPAVLVLVAEPEISYLVGWCYGYEGQQEKYWAEEIPRPCYMVPQEDLRPMHELFRILGIEENAPMPVMDPSEEEILRILAGA